VFILHDRLEPPVDSGKKSETEEAWDLAQQLWGRESPVHEVCVFFKRVPTRRFRRPGTRLATVLAFKEKLAADQRVKIAQYDTATTFAAALEEYLARWVRTLGTFLNQYLTDAMRAVEFLRTVELFRTLTPRQITDCAENLRQRHFNVGDTIIREGEVGEEFFIILSGEVDVIRAEHEVARLSEGDFFGEAALITGEPRNATIIADTQVDTYVLDKANFRTVIEASAPFRDQLYRVYFLRQEPLPQIAP
jgi:hypothetical protein